MNANLFLEQTKMSLKGISGGDILEVPADDVYVILERLSAEETQAVLIEVEAHHSAFSDFSGTFRART